MSLLKSFGVCRSIFQFINFVSTHPHNFYRSVCIRPLENISGWCHVTRVLPTSSGVDTWVPYLWVNSPRQVELVSSVRGRVLTPVVSRVYPSVRRLILYRPTSTPSLTLIVVITFVLYSMQSGCRVNNFFVLNRYIILKVQSITNSG